MKKILSVFLLLFITATAIAQEKGFIQGIILDKDANNEPLAFVNISIKNSQKSLTSDALGRYDFYENPGTYTLVVGFAGYQKIEVPIVIKSGEVTILKNISLERLQLKSIAFTSSLKTN